MTVPIDIGLIGATGKMGKRIIALCDKDPHLRISVGICSKPTEQAGIVCSHHLSALSSVQIAIDFSTAALLPSIVDFALQNKTPLVIGTTGLDEKHFTLLRHASRSLPIFQAANFSIGIALLIEMAKRISHAIPENFSIGIEETHHIHKKDAPSGTAREIAQAVPEKRRPTIVSKREGEVIGEHSISFTSSEERLILSHSGLSRDVYAKGALLATKFLKDKPPGLYGMADLLFQGTL